MKKFITAALMVVVLASAVTVFASENIWARVEKVDTANNTISAWNGQLGNFTIKFNSSTKVTKDGTTIALKDIQVGSHIEGSATKQSDGTYLGETLTVTLGRNGQTCNGLSGKIQTIDVSTRTVTLTSAKNGTFKVTLKSDAKITVNSKDAKIEDLKVGYMVWFAGTKNDDGTYTATSIDAKDSNGNGNGNGKCNGLSGKIQTIDVSTRTITLASANNGTFKVTLKSDAKITVNGKDAKIEDLKVDYMVWFTGTKNTDGTYTVTSVDAKDGNGNGNGNGGGCGGGKGQGGKGHGRK